MSDKTIIIHAGDIIDGITVDGKLFGDNDGWPTTVNLKSDEYVYGIEFGYHTHRKGLQFFESDAE